VSNQRANLQVNAFSGDFEGWIFDNSNWRKWLQVNRMNGNVGIGTGTPAYKLDVAGAINATSILINGSPFAGGGSQWATVGSTINFPTGNVGIGNTSPVSKLTIGSLVGTATSSNGIVLGSDQNSIEFINSPSGPGYGAKLYGVDQGN